MSKRSPTSISATIDNHEGGTHRDKKAKVEDPSFDDELLYKLNCLPKEDIIECLAQAWRSTSKEGGNMKPLLQQAVEEAFLEEEEDVISEWTGVDNPEMILKYNWKHADSECKMNIKDAVGKGAKKIELSGEDLSCTILLEEFVRVCKEGGEFFFEDNLNRDIEDETERWGCPECSAPGSTLALRMESRFVNEGFEYRLVTESDVKCACMSLYKCPESVCGGEEIYYPVL